MPLIPVSDKHLRARMAQRPAGYEAEYAPALTRTADGLDARHRSSRARGHR